MSNDGSFTPIEATDLTRVGPRAILVSGYPADATAALNELLAHIGAADAPLVFCAEAMLPMSLADALARPDLGPPVPPEKLPPVMVLSGLTGRELHSFLEHFAQTGLRRPIFASATETNLTYTVRQLLAALWQEQKAREQR